MFTYLLELHCLCGRHGIPVESDVRFIRIGRVRHRAVILSRAIRPLAAEIKIKELSLRG